jgi:hypothetical protein
LRANKNGDEIRTAKKYMIRNHNIVNETDIIVAFSPTDKEIIRSGTWATIRYAHKKNKKVIIIFPNGNVSKNF